MFKYYFQRTTSAAPLAVFRIAFGLLLFASIVRFWANGWIEELYIKPKFFFSFYGFEFVTPLGEYTYIVFAGCAIAALFVALGLYYRVASVLLFLSFTYIELMDKSTYLNHYYFVSMICVMMMLLPAHASFSLDARRNSEVSGSKIPLWCGDSLKLFVCILYFYAGLAKVNSDWLLHAQPLKIWLPAKNDLPVIGWLFDYVWVAYALSWIGCLYDLSIPFLLLNKSTRLVGYSLVIVFHLLTSILFPIGMFPFIMIATALIFFSDSFHEKIISKVRALFGVSDIVSEKIYSFNPVSRRILIFSFAIFFAVQIVLPFRYLFYPGELFWTEEGYRFSWRVMLIEKAGTAEFLVKDKTGKVAVVDNKDFLTPLQEKMMSTQPDMILQYAHMLRDYYSEKGFRDPSVFADTYVTLNGRLGRQLIDPKIDLAKIKDSFAHKPWIIPLEHEIAGF